MTKKQSMVGAMMILAGSVQFVGALIGYGKTWPLYLMGSGILMWMAPWTDDPAKRNQYRMGGVWMILAGIGGILAVFGIHSLYAPLGLIGAGVIGLTGWFQKKEA